MKMMQKRAQTATEYLIILAVVIIIALIVVGVLGGIPGIGGGAGTASKTAFWSTSKVGIDSLALNSTGYIDVTFRNNLANSIKIRKFWVDDTISGRDASTLPASNTTVKTAAPGEIAIYNNQNATGLYVATGNACTPGQTVTLYLKVEYEELATSAIFNYTGQNSPYDVTCS